MHCTRWIQARLAAVEALTALVPCGAVDMILQLTAWQDPHYVPVAAFYAPDVRVNYLARLAADRAVAVRLPSHRCKQFAHLDRADGGREEGGKNTREK